MADVAAAIAAIDALIVRLDEATRKAVADETASVEADAKNLAPLKTGTLRRSILPTPAKLTLPHVYEAAVGPTVVYGRQKELGGHIYPVRAKALRFIAKDGMLVFAGHVYQHPQPYMKPGADLARGRFTKVIQRRLAPVIVSI